MKSLFAALLVGVTLVGCSMGSSVVGHWEGPVPIQGTNLPGRFEFKADKTYVATFEQNGVKVAMTGTYELKEGNLETKVTGAKLEGDLPPAAAQYKSVVDQQLAGLAGQSSSGAFKFEGADKATWDIGKGVTATLTRVKS